MKNKIIVLLSAFILCMTLGLKEAMAAGAATDVNCTNPCINSYEIQDGQVATTDIANDAVTNAKIADGAVSNTKILDGAVTTPKIADGAVTDAKITGPISSSKIQKPANVIVVAKSGGDFTSIQAAIDSINPTADNPYLIKVMPGTYVENITMKSYIHLQGAGRDVATIQSPTSTNYVVTLRRLSSVIITGFTITNGTTGIFCEFSSIVIENNTVRGNIIGIYYSSASSVKVIGNMVIENTSFAIVTAGSFSTIINNIIKNNAAGVFLFLDDSTLIGNTIIGNNANGITIQQSTSPIITGNNITGSGQYGLVIEKGSTPTLIHNKIAGNGGNGPTYTDIYVESGSVPNISFNVYDDITGDTGVGQFNVKSDGTLAPAP